MHLCKCHLLHNLLALQEDVQGGNRENISGPFCEHLREVEKKRHRCVKTSCVGSQAGVVDINYAFHLCYKFVCGLTFSRSLPDFEGFLPALRFPPSSKLTPSSFQFDRMQDLPENHFRVSGASWVNIINYLIFLITPYPYTTGAQKAAEVSNKNSSFN